MNGRRPISKRRRFRFKALAIALLGVVILGTGGAGIYFMQRERNTQKLKTRAEEAVTRSDWTEAASSYRQYLNRRDDDGEALAAYADVLVTISKETPEQLGNAVRVLQRLVREQPANVKAMRDLTSAYLLVAEHTLAADMAGNWVKLAPDSAEAVVSLATAQRGLGKYDLALESLLGGVERMPKEASLYPPIIALYTVELRKPEEGKVWLDRALVAAPQSHSVQLAAFAYFNSRGDLAKAEEHLALALQSAPDDPAVLLPAASYYTERGDMAKAKDILDRIAAKAPSDQRGLIARAAWASRSRDAAVMTETAKHLEEKAGDKNSEILARAAELYLAARVADGADRCIAKLEAIPNPNQALQTWLSALRGSRDVTGGRPHGAIAHLEEVIRKEPNDERTLELLGRAYLEMGALEPAADAYRRLLARAPDAAGIRITLARIEFQLGRDSAATGLLTAMTNATAEQQAQVELLKLACDMRRALSSSPSAAQLNDLRSRIQNLAGKPVVDEPSARLLSTCLGMAAYPAEMNAAIQARMADENTGAIIGEEYAGFLLFQKRYDEAKHIIDGLEQRAEALERSRKLKVKWLAGTSGIPDARKFVDSANLEPAVKGQLLVALGDQCTDLGEREAAREAYVAAAALLPESIPLLQQVRRLAASREQALEAATKIQGIEGEAGLFWRFERALALMQFTPDVETVREAVGLLQYCVDKRNDWPAAYAALGNASELLGDWSGAVQAYQSAINQQPSLATGGVALRLVGVLNRLSRHVDADVLLGRMLEANPRSPDALALSVEKHVRNKDLAAATTAAEQLLAVKPDDPAVAALVGDLMLQGGDIDRAEEVINRAIKAHPEAVAVQWSQVRIRLAQKKNDEARIAARRIAEKEGTAKDYWFLGQVYEQLGESTDAEAALNKAIEIAPNDAQLLAGVSEYWRTRGDRVKQLDMARRAVAARGSDAHATLALAELLADSNSSSSELKEAADLVAQRLKDAPDDPRALTLDALLTGLRDNPDLDHAMKQLQRALALNPKMTKAQQLLAAVQVRRGDMKAASDAAAAGLALSPDDVDLLLLSAEIHGYRGAYDQAMFPLRRVLELRPRYAPALRLLPLAAERANQVDRTIKLVELGAAGKPNAEEAIALARMYEVKKDAAKADALYQQAVLTSPADSSVFQAWLQFQARQGAFGRVHDLAEKRKADYPEDAASILAAGHILGLQTVDAKLHEKGIAWLMAIASSQPALAPDAMYRAGVCHLQGGDTSQAESAFLQAAQSAPTSAEPVNALAWLYSEELNRPADAMAVLQKFLAAGGRETPQMLDTHGAVLLRLGQLDAARAKLLACVEAAGQTETLTAATFHLGKLLHQQQKQSDAVVHLRRAMDLDKRYGGLSERERLAINEMLTGNDASGTPKDN